MEHMPVATTWTASRQAGGGLGQPVRGVISGAALHLPQQPLLPGQVKKAGVPPIGEQLILPGLLIGTPPGPAAAVLIDAQARHRGRRLLQHRVRGGGERLVRDRPRHPGVPGRLGRGDPPPGHLGAGLLPQPPGDTAPRRDLRHPLGERLARAAPLIAFPAALHPAQIHPDRAAAHVPRPRQHILMHPPGRRRAIRAHPSRRMIGDRPYLQRAAGAGPGLSDLQASDTEQHRHHILGRRGPPGILDRHTSGSWGPAPAHRMNDTPRTAPVRSQSRCLGRR